MSSLPTSNSLSSVSSFDNSFARRFGLHEAIVFARLKILYFKNYDSMQNYYNERIWVDINEHIYRTYLYFLPKQDINYALKSLEDQKVIISLETNETTLFSIIEQYL